MKYVITRNNVNTHQKLYLKSLDNFEEQTTSSIIEAYKYNSAEAAIFALRIMLPIGTEYPAIFYSIEAVKDTVFIGRISRVTVNDDHSTSTKTRIVVADDESKCKSAIARVQQEMLDELKKEYPSLKYLYSNTWTANPEVSKSFDFEVTIEQGEKV